MWNCRKHCVTKTRVRKHRNETTAGQPVHTTFDSSLSGKAQRNHFLGGSQGVIPPLQVSRVITPKGSCAQTQEQRRSSRLISVTTDTGGPRCVRLRSENGLTHQKTPLAESGRREQLLISTVAICIRQCVLMKRAVLF